MPFRLARELPCQCHCPASLAGDFAPIVVQCYGIMAFIAQQDHQVLFRPPLSGTWAMYSRGARA